MTKSCATCRQYRLKNGVYSCACIFNEKGTPDPPDVCAYYEIGSPQPPFEIVAAAEREQQARKELNNG